MAEAALKSLTDVVTGLQQRVELKTTIQKISPHDFGHTSVSFAGNHLEDSKVFLSRFNKLALLKRLNEADKLKAFPLALSGRAYQWYQSKRQMPRIAGLRYVNSLIRHTVLLQPRLWNNSYSLNEHRG